MTEKKAEVVLGNSRPKQFNVRESKNWCFTWNNPKHKLDFKEFSNNLIYMVYQLEKGENKTPHYQGYIHLARKKDMLYMKKHFIYEAHWEACRGTPEENIAYCTKEETKDEGPWEIGDKRNITHQGERTDLKEMMERWIECKSNIRMVEEYGDKWITNRNKIMSIATDVVCEVSSRENRDLKCVFIYGEPGTGKSFLARKLLPGAYPMKGNMKWWGFYKGEESVIFDDVNEIKDEDKDEWLKVLDKYPYWVDVKNSHVWLNFNNVVVTSNETLSKLWNHEKWIRRFCRIIYCWREGSKKEDYVYKWKDMM